MAQTTNKSNKNSKQAILSEDTSLKMTGTTSALPPDQSKVSTSWQTNSYTDCKNSGTMETTDPWMQRFTTSIFDKLHIQLCPILDNSFSLPENQDHVFHKKWQDSLSS
jgi:hypothetical protein